MNCSQVVKTFALRICRFKHSIKKQNDEKCRDLAPRTNNNVTWRFGDLKLLSNANESNSSEEPIIRKKRRAPSTPADSARDWRRKPVKRGGGGGGGKKKKERQKTNSQPWIRNLRWESREYELHRSAFTIELHQREETLRKRKFFWRLSRSFKKVCPAEPVFQVGNDSSTTVTKCRMNTVRAVPRGYQLPLPECIGEMWHKYRARNLPRKMLGPLIQLLFKPHWWALFCWLFTNFLTICCQFCQTWAEVYHVVDLDA